MEDSVVGPDALSQLFVDTDPLGCPLPDLELLSGTMEQAVLRWPTGGCEFWLADPLRVFDSFTAWLVMPFVNQYRAVILQPIVIGCIGPNRHQNH